MTNFWNGFFKQASEADFDRTGRESTAISEEREKWDNSKEKEPRTKLQYNVAGAPAGGLC